MHNGNGKTQLGNSCIIDWLRLRVPFREHNEQELLYRLTHELLINHNVRNYSIES
jgi:hypothetical protein